MTTTEDAPVVDVDDGLDAGERVFVQRLAADPEALAAIVAYGEDPSDENDRALDAALDRLFPADEGESVTAAGNAERLRQYWRREEGGAKIGWGGGGDFTRCVASLSKYLGAGAKGYCAKRHKEMTGMWPGDRRNASIAADAGSDLVRPPAEWFADPRLDKPTPMRIEDNGRVFGHVAAWDTEHRGLPGVRPPRSMSGYSEFLTHVRRVDTGDDVPVGSLTWGGGHADLTADASEARRHYDDTTTQVADVTVGEDEHGIWMAGAIRPGLSPEQLVAVRGSAPSGDWRAVRGNLEMLAAHLVPVPGFPVPRQRSYALAASGASPFALVAAGAVLPADGEREALHRMVDDLTSALTSLRDDVTPLLAAARSRVESERRAALDDARGLLAAVWDESKYSRQAGRFAPKGAGGRQPMARDAVLRKRRAANATRVLRARQRTQAQQDGGTGGPEGGKAPTVSPTGAKLTRGPFEDGSAEYSDGQVWDPETRSFRKVRRYNPQTKRFDAVTASLPDEDVEAIVVAVLDAVDVVDEELAAQQATLDTARALMAGGPPAFVRERLAEKGAALPDGSFPIRNATDLAKAIKAVGRAKDTDAARRHVVKRARALGLVSQLPDGWA